MAQQYYSLETAAEILGVTPAELHRMREQGRVRAFRDSGNWKFKREDIEQIAAEQKTRQAPPSESTDDESEDVLLSELELGESDASSSGTVIGTAKPASEESDIQLAGSDVAIERKGDEPEPEAPEEPVDAVAKELEELDLTIDEDVPLEDSQIALADTGGAVQEGSGGSGGELGEDLEDDDLVLGGSGSGSDITIGQDSGISLVDPHDSGLSLDEPMELASDEESLALGEDEMLALSEEAEVESPAELQADDDFLLTPLEEGADEEDSESGSQVIALDTAEAGDEEATMVAGAPVMGAPAMLDEEMAGVGVAEGAPLLEPMAAAPAAAPKPAAPGVPLTPGAAALPETPYGTLAMVGLIGCVIFLILSGIMAFDLVRNMWSWNGAYELNSSLMDTILSWF
jgi:hypothetical protein